MRVFYRIYPGKQDGRPFANGDKELLVRTCLRSFMSSVAEVNSVTITFLMDGCPTKWSLIVHAIVRPYLDAGSIGHYDIVELNGVGNKPSFLKQLEMSLDGHPDEFIYFSEDDYLYSRDAMTALDYASVEPDFFTLYDHPDRYRLDDDQILKKAPRPIEVIGYHHWRQVESTCMTFGAQRKLLVANEETLREHACNGREMWYRLLDEHILWGAIPGLATHVENNMLSPCVAWQDVWDRSLEYHGTNIS